MLCSSISRRVGCAAYPSGELMLAIANHVLLGDNVLQEETENTTGGTIIPKFLVAHFTAGLTADSAIRWFKNKESRVSAHIVIGRDGKITQMLPFNVKGWHAGPSYWRGHSDLNNHSIGIEIVNYGPTPLYDDKFIYPRRPGDFKPIKRPTSDWLMAEHPLEKGRKQFWQTYTAEQYDVLDDLVPLLVDTYKLREIVGHEEIATPQGRKTDPGPMFALSYYKEFCEHGNAGGVGAYTVIVNDLKVRGGPGPEYAEVGEPLSKGVLLRVLEIDTATKWAIVQIGTQRAYVHSSFIVRS